MKVFKSEANLACAAYARDLLNSQLRASLVPIMNNATQHVENKNTYLNAWKYRIPPNASSHAKQ
eukprot:5821236-Amphidinium_carterae.1